MVPCSPLMLNWGEILVSCPREEKKLPKASAVGVWVLAAFVCVASEFGGEGKGV